MADETKLTPEALDKLESTAIELLEALPGSEGATAVLNLCRAYRTQESALNIAAEETDDRDKAQTVRDWKLLAEARAQEGKPEVQERRDGNIPYLD